VLSAHCALIYSVFAKGIENPTSADFDDLMAN